jgi:FAD/FMN-containing dehydrogenase
VLITAAVYAGPADDGEAVLRPIGRFGEPLADLSGPLPYRTVQSNFDAFFPKGELLSYWKSADAQAFGDELVEVVIRRGLQRPHPRTLVHVPHMGGAVQRVGSRDSAFGDRSLQYVVSFDGNWTDPADTEQNIAWVRAAYDEVTRLPAASGTYLNFSGDAILDSATSQAVFGDNLERLARIKREYDPDNRFRLNNNIQPAAG